MTYSQFAAYLTEFATRFRELKHTPQQPRVATMDIEEIIEASTGPFDLRKPGIVITDMSGEVTGATTDHPRDTPTFTFLIVQHAPHGRPDLQVQAIETCHRIGLKFIGKALHDREQGRPETRGLLLDETKYELTGPLFDSAYGVQFYFSASRNITDLLAYDPDDYEYD